MRERKPRSNWREKLPPAFVAIAGLERDLETRWSQVEQRQRARLERLKPDASEAEKRAVNEEFDKDRSAFAARADNGIAQLQAEFPDMPGNSLAFGYRSDSPLTDDRGLAEWFHFQRHGEALRTDEQRQLAGDFSALQRIQRTQEDVWRGQHRQGPIKPFQIDEIHRSLLEQLIWFEPADNPLTAEERADCFDELCGCGQIHDADALQKQYKRLKKDLTNAEIPKNTEIK